MVYAQPPVIQPPVTNLQPPPPSRRQPTQKRSGWRTFRVFIGELLITAGRIIGGYAFWELWWTTHLVQPGMQAAISEFQEANPTPETHVEPAHRTDAPPMVNQPYYGEIFSVMHVPKWNFMQIPVVEGTGQELLDRGYAGHYVETQLPGEVGNFAVAGHRRTYGNNFRRVDILTPGDPVVVETDNAYIVYEVIGHEIVQPSQASVVYPVPNEPGAVPTERLLTMTTCHPEFGNSERYIVYSKFAYWTAKSEGKPSVVIDGATQ